VGLGIPRWLPSPFTHEERDVRVFPEDRLSIRAVRCCGRRVFPARAVVAARQLEGATLGHDRRRQWGPDVGTGE